MQVFYPETQNKGLGKICGQNLAKIKIQVAFVCAHKYKRECLPPLSPFLFQCVYFLFVTFLPAGYRRGALARYINIAKAIPTFSCEVCFNPSRPGFSQVHISTSLFFKQKSFYDGRHGKFTICQKYVTAGGPT